MLSSFWNWFVILLTIGSLLACWWLLHWTKGISNREGSKIGSTGHVWDENLVELNAPLPRWWLHLFNITIIFAMAYLVVYPGLGNVPGLFGWTQIGSYDAEVDRVRATQEAVYARYREMDPAALVADAEAMAIGRRLFANNCAMCHGSDGRGATGFPNLTDADWLYGAAYEQVLTSINMGRMGVMPPWGAALGEEGVREMTEFVLSMAGQQANPAQAAAGKEKFGLFCAACHGPDGNGNQALGAPDLGDDIWLYGSTREVIAATLTDGRNGQMPAHKDLLNEDRQRVLAAYVLSLSAPQAQ